MCPASTAEDEGQGKVDYLLIRGDARQLPLADNSVQCVVTSPPYFGLRDYGTAEWVGGRETCDHLPPAEWTEKNFNAGSTLPRHRRNQTANGGARWYRADGSCRCGARRTDRQIGLEATVEDYVAQLVEVFRDVRRVLRDDGTAWVNLGDAYCSGTAAPRKPTTTTGKEVPASWSNRCQPERIAATDGLKAKDLIGIPWLIAFALRADGWYLRSDIIWAKPNPMPESITDRPTRSHEYVFLLSKSSRYYYDADAIREPNSTPAQLAHNLKYAKPYPVFDANDQMAGRVGGPYTPGKHARPGGEGRNKRSVWTINPEPTPEAHFATFPEALVTPCIKAGSKAGDVVLDPFCGSGTVGVVALRYGRRFVGIDLSEKYLSDIARPRVSRAEFKYSAPLFRPEQAQLFGGE